MSEKAGNAKRQPSAEASDRPEAKRSATSAARRVKSIHAARELLPKASGTRGDPAAAADLSTPLSAADARAFLAGLFGAASLDEAAWQAAEKCLTPDAEGRFDPVELLACFRIWSKPHAEPRSALIVVDVQHDFIDGSLALKNCAAAEDGAEVVPVINKLRQEAAFDLVVLSLDWHPKDHISFYSKLDKSRVHATETDKLEKAKLFDEIKLSDGTPQVMWPDHCVQNTKGAELYPSLKRLGSDERIHKGINTAVDSYSAFYDNTKGASTGLTDVLRDAQIERTFVCGLAYDVCVGFTALHSQEEGFETFVVSDACRGVDPKGKEAMTERLKKAGVKLISSEAVPAAVLRAPASPEA